jgi:hypothetical protein
MKVVYARVGKTWVVAPDGTRVWVHIGQHWPADDPVVKKYPSLFSDDPVTGLSFTVTPKPPAPAAPVEQATAAPGERRSVRRPRRAEQDESRQQ